MGEIKLQISKLKERLLMEERINMLELIDILECIVEKIEK